MMTKPYTAVLGIAFLDLLAAATSLLVIDQIGVIAAVLQFLLYTAMALGLLALRKWARVHGFRPLYIFELDRSCSHC
jgi:uncharacterized membrane-anchored protein